MTHLANISEQMRTMLKRHWGYEEFRPGQEAIIRSVIDRRDTLALMPTGGGKSITYQLPTLMSEGLCIVVTPLISLMKDQVDHLRRRGISAAAIHSGMSYRQIDIALDNCVYGDTKFLYISPERLSTEAFRLRVERMPVCLLAIDEAHCISQWGYDFRPSYLRIAEIRRKLHDVPILALTASATELVAEDIMRQLQFSERHIIRSSFARPNLSYVVRHTDDKDEQLLRIVESVEGSGIVYARTREGCEQIASKLCENGHSAAFYHAGLPHLERTLRQEEWTSGKVRIMVATNAFGMGIDKADVRFVIHYSMCESMENYYQEAGRAGRDGRRSYVVLLVASNDSHNIEKHFDSDFPPLEDIKDIYEKICCHLQIAIGDGLYSSFVFNIHEFCSTYRIYGGKVRAALKILQQNGYMTLTEEMENPARIMFCVTRDDLYKIRIERHDLDHTIRTILRMYNGVFTEFKAIDEREIATVSGYTVEHVKELLKRMWQMRIIRYIPSNSSPMIFMDEERLPTKDVFIAPDTYLHRKNLGLERLNNVVGYATNQSECRSVVIQRYFGDKEATPCGICDICLAARRAKRTSENPQNSLSDKILEILRNAPLSSREIARIVKAEPDRIAQTIDKLKAEGKISTTDGGKLLINSYFWNNLIIR